MYVRPSEWFESSRARAFLVSDKTTVDNYIIIIITVYYTALRHLCVYFPLFLYTRRVLHIFFFFSIVSSFFIIIIFSHILLREIDFSGTGLGPVYDDA